MLDELTRKLDYDDYAAIPADGKRWEILDGEPYVTPSPNPFHQRASKRLQRLLEAWFESGETPRGEVFNAPLDLLLGDHDICQPDLVVVTVPGQVTRRGVEGTPALVVEVLSPTNRPYDRVTKMRRYAANQVPNYWIVDPDLQSVDCYRLVGDRYVDAGSFGPADTLRAVDFPGLALDLAVIWR
jgi:Uma2 family endonuclease